MLPLPRARTAGLPVLFVCAWLAWRGSSAALALGQELVGHDWGWQLARLFAGEDERLELGLAREDDQFGRTRGTHLALFRAIEAHVEPAGVVQVVRYDWVRGVRLPALVNLIAPRRFVPLPHGAAPAAGRESALLELENELGGAEGSLAPRRLVARGPDWCLWQ